MSRPFLLGLQLRGELWKLFARRRTYIGFGSFLVIETLFLFLHYLPFVKRHLQHSIEQAGYAFDQYFSGLTLAFMVVSWTAFLLGSLYLALVGGDVVAKEVEDGTMRLILSRPVSRMRVVLVRYAAVVFYTFILMAFIALSALFIGWIKQGFGGLFVLAPAQHIFAIYDFWPGLQRYLLAIPLLGLSFTTITTLGFAFSCCNMKPATATILCLSYYFVDMILQGIPQFESIRAWFLTTHLLSWMNIFHAQVPVLKMAEDYAYLIGADATFVIFGILIFQTRDFKA